MEPIGVVGVQADHVMGAKLHHGGHDPLAGERAGVSCVLEGEGRRQTKQLQKQVARMFGELLPDPLDAFPERLARRRVQERAGVALELIRELLGAHDGQVLGGEFDEFCDLIESWQIVHTILLILYSLVFVGTLL